MNIKLNQQGIAHLFVPIAALVLIGVVGTYIVVRSNAATPTHACAAKPYEKNGVYNSACVSELQSRLNSVSSKTGASKLGVDGDFGPKTETALKAYQSKYMGKGEADGVAGPKTWASLVKNTKYSGGSSTKEGRDDNDGKAAAISYFSTTDHYNSKKVTLGDNITLMWAATGDNLACKLTRSGGGDNSTIDVASKASRLQKFTKSGSYKFTLDCKNTVSKASTSKVVYITVEPNTPVIKPL